MPAKNASTIKKVALFLMNYVLFFMIRAQKIPKKAEPLPDMEA